MKYIKKFEKYDKKQGGLSKMTTLMQAAGAGDIKKVKELIEKGSDVNLRFDAILNGESGRPSGTNWQNRTALIFSLAEIFKSGQTPKIVKELINAGANLDIQDREGRTALIFAAFMSNVGWASNRDNGLHEETYEYIEMLKDLINAGANLYIEDNPSGNVFIYPSADDNSKHHDFFYYLKDDIKNILIEEFPNNDFFINKKFELNIKKFNV